jgi:hypothetical protein
MKKLLLLLSFLIALPITASQNEPIKDCKCKGKKLYGRVKVVERGYISDFRVKVVERGYIEDFRVRIVDLAPNYCGEWQFVDCGEDFRIEFVDCGEDFRILYVDYQPY